jgi:hypothetical protein
VVPYAEREGYTQSLRHQDVMGDDGGEVEEDKIGIGRGISINSAPRDRRCIDSSAWV